MGKNNLKEKTAAIFKEDKKSEAPFVTYKVYAELIQPSDKHNVNPFQSKSRLSTTDFFDWTPIDHKH
ncbi:MAG: hypothetical protein RR202_01860 [Bacteroidales bacterium]